MTTVLATEGLTAGYAGVPVVRDLDLTVDAGEVVALLGPNGAGKTTTLLTLAGVVPKIAGSAKVLDEEVAGGRPHKVARRGAVLSRTTARSSSTSPPARTCASARAARPAATPSTWCSSTSRR